MIVSKPEYIHIRWMNDKYLRNVNYEEWYYWSDFSWLYMNWIDYQQIEEEYQKYLKSCELSLPVLEGVPTPTYSLLPSTNADGNQPQSSAGWPKVPTHWASDTQKTAESLWKNIRPIGTDTEGAQVRLEI